MSVCPVCGCKTDELDFVLCTIEKNEEMVCSFCEKQIKKFYDVIEDFYIKGDSATINTIVALLAAAAYKNDAVTAKIKETLADNKHFLNSFVIFLPFFAKNKKLLYALVKGDK